MLIAQFCAHSAEGHGRHRVHGPGRRLARLPGVTVVDCDAYHRRSEWLFDHADVLVLHGINPELLPVVHRRRAGGRVTTFEACDYYMDVQGWNPHVAGWLDRTLIDQFWQLVAAVDAVQTSTDLLADVWRPVARRVGVFDNGIDDVPPLRDPPPRPFTVGWAGSVTHLADWFRTAPVLEAWVRANPGTRLAAMTDERASGFVRLPKDQYLFRPSGSWEDYRTFLGELDVGVVPLLSSPFNRGRTDLKYLEFAAHGVVGVYADATPYRGSVVPEETGLLFADDAELHRCLDRLKADADLRTKLREGGHRAASNRSPDAVTAKRSEFYRELLVNPPKDPPLPTELVADAVADGRYHVLNPAEPERLVTACQTESATAERLAEVEAVFARHPQYPAAGRIVARMRNDLGRFADGFVAAERVLAVRPDSPGAWVEVARAHIGMGDKQAARHAVDRALVHNPGHPTAWALRVKYTGDTATAGRMAVRQPSSFMAALVAARFFPPAERVGRLRMAVEKFAPELLPEERPFAAAAFGQVLTDGLDIDDLPPGGLELFETAAEAFPESVRIADGYGRALHAAGKIADATRAFARAGELARIGQTYQLDADAVEGRQFQWQICEYLERWERS